MTLLETLRNLSNNGGLTLRKYKAVQYKTGYQVADHGVECKTAEEAVKAVDAMGGNCGIWFSDGVYYVDHSFRVSTKKTALETGRRHNQISVLKWADMSLVYC